MTDTLKVGDVDIQIVDRLPDENDVVVCMLKAESESYFTDNQEAPCFGCGRTLVFRPYMARGQKMCMSCVSARMNPN